MILSVAPLFQLSGSRGTLVDAAKALTLLREGLTLGVSGWIRRGCQGADPPPRWARSHLPRGMPDAQVSAISSVQHAYNTLPSGYRNGVC